MSLKIISSLVFLTFCILTIDVSRAATIVSQEKLIENLQPLIKKQLSSQSVIVQWDAPLNTSVYGYNLYYGNKSRGYDHKIYIPITPIAENIENSSIILERIGTGIVYYFAVTALDITGNESDYSDEVRFSGGEIVNTINTKNQTRLFIEGQIGWTINIAFSSDGLHWRLYRTITSQSLKYSIDITNIKNKNIFWIIPQKEIIP